MSTEPVDPADWSVELDDEATDFDPDVLVDAEPDTQTEALRQPAVDLVKAGAPGQLARWSAPSRFMRREVVPGWLRSREDAVAAARWAALHSSTTAGYHAIRSPKYAARLVAGSPRGAHRVVIGTARWVADVEARPLRQAMVNRAADPGEWRRFEEARKQQLRSRVGLALLMLLAPSGLLVGVLASHLAGLAKAGFVFATLALLGLIGRRADKPIVDPTIVTPRARKLTADVVLRAFIGSGLCKDADPITFPQPIQRDGNGWRAVIDLPYGATAEDAMKRRDKLASGLDLDEVLVWPERVRGASGSARRVSLWVADEDPFAKGAGAWPWAKSKAEASLFDPFPFGQDRRGRAITLRLIFSSFLVGAIPRMGKTYAARLVACAAALDPRAELHVWDGKGGQDWRAFSKIAYRAGYGAREETIAALRDDLRAAQVDVARRYDVLGKLPADLCPESKITPALVRRKSFGLHPVVFVIDECQRYFEHPEFGADIVDAATDLAKVGPAVGFVIILATQKPDNRAIPTKLRDVIGTRFAGKVMTWQSSEAVLGSGSYTAGYDASRFQRSHKGVGWLLGADDETDVDDALVVRTYLADTAAVDAIIGRAHAARRAAGTLTGLAAGEEPEPVAVVDVLTDAIAVYADSDDGKLWSETICDRLRELRPEHYADWTPLQLAAALRPYGPVPAQIWSDGRNRRGFHRAELVAAANTRAVARANRDGASIDEGEA
jgi:S-DNA-T family DNA segregation ATPase FtsK/SpoIIIE